jgi:hypothetical protein
MWRIGVTQDNSEILDLLPEQLRQMAQRYPEDTAQFQELAKLITYKEAHHGKHNEPNGRTA